MKGSDEMSVRFYFVRHGQADSNLRNDYYNDEEAKLTELGKAQAAKAGVELKKLNVRFKAIFVSPYQRAIDTCRIALFRADRRLLATVDERIGERRFDGLVGQKINEFHNRELYDYSSCRSEIDGVETLESLEQRARDFIRYVIREYHDGDFLVFSHGVFGLAFKAVIQGRPKTGNLYDWDLLGNGEMMVLDVLEV